MSCEEGEMRRRLPRSPVPAAPLENDDLLSEILLRLPPLPSSLPRASAVCKRWRSLASDPGFSRRFRRHHRHNPPFLGCFRRDGNGLRFDPTLEPPNRVPQARFHFPADDGDRYYAFLGCGHGFVLMLRVSQKTLKLLVWDPVNGHQHPLDIPPVFGGKGRINGVVLRTVLGDIQNFHVVFVSTDVKQQVIAYVYSLETGVWGDHIPTPLPPKVSSCNISQGSVLDRRKPAVLVGDSLYMLLLGKPPSIIRFDVARQGLAVIPQPVLLDWNPSLYYSVMRAEGGGLGLLFLSVSDFSIQLWKRNTDCDGAASWVLGRTVELDKLISLDLQNRRNIHIHGFAAENNAVFLWSYGGVFMIQLDSLQFKKLPKISMDICHPFEVVYAAGI